MNIERQKLRTAVMMVFGAHDCTAYIRDQFDDAFTFITDMRKEDIERAARDIPEGKLRVALDGTINIDDLITELEHVLNAGS